MDDRRPIESGYADSGRGQIVVKAVKDVLRFSIRENPTIRQCLPGLSIGALAGAFAGLEAANGGMLTDQFGNWLIGDALIEILVGACAGGFLAGWMFFYGYGITYSELKRKQQAALDELTRRIAATEASRPPGTSS